VLEGIQEAEIRIFIEQAIDRKALSDDLAKEATKALDDYFMGNLAGELSWSGWQSRSRALYQMAAKVAARVGLDVNRTAYAVDVPAMGRTKLALKLRNWTGQARSWKAAASDKWLVPERVEGSLTGHESLEVVISGAGMEIGATSDGKLAITDMASGSTCDVAIKARATPPMDLLFEHAAFNLEPGKTDTRDFRVVNYAADEQTWSFASSAPWLKIAPAEGKLAAGASVFVKVTASPAERGAAALDAALTFNGAGGKVKKTVASKTFVIPPYSDPIDLPMGRVLRLEKMDPAKLKSHRLTANGDKTLLYYWDVRPAPAKPSFFFNATAIVGKKKFDRFMQVLPRHETVYNIEGTDIDAFSAWVGVENSTAKEKIRHHERLVNFEIYVDGKPVTQSGLMTTRDEPRLLVVKSLGGAKEVKLATRLDSNMDNPNYPVIWANPEFYTTK
jgi:hypothetical protein